MLSVCWRNRLKVHGDPVRKAAIAVFGVFIIPPEFIRED
jgi:hypothetical protein